MLHRQLHLLVLTGLQLDRAALLRLWYVQATGCDPVEPGRSIHSLTHLTRIVEQRRGSRALVVLGAPLTSREQIYQAIDRQDAYWLSDDKLLLITSTGPIIRDVRRDDPAKWKGRADLLHIRTGKRESLNGLTALLNRIHAMPEEFQVSPSGAWLEWHSTQRGELGDSALAHLDGTGYRTIDDD